MHTINYYAGAILLLLLLSSTATYAQESPQASFEFRLGVAPTILKDQNFSQLRLTGSPLFLTLQYEKQKGNRLWQFAFTPGYGKIKIKDGFFPTDDVQLNMHLIYAQAIRNVAIGDDFGLYLGGKLRSSTRILIYDGFENGGWLTTQGLDLFARFHYPIGDNQQLEANISYPLFAFVARPPYGGYDSYVYENSNNVPKVIYSRANFETGATYVHPQIGVHYRYQLNKMSIVASWDMAYVSYQEVKPIQSFSHALGVGLRFKVGSNK